MFVSPELGVDVPHHGISLPAETVVVVVSAEVVAEFLVGPSNNGIAAIHACFFHGHVS